MPFKNQDTEIAAELPLLAVRDLVIFTDMILPLFIGRDISVAAVEAAQNGDKQLLVLAQKDRLKDLPGPDDLYRVGTVAQLLRQLRMPDGRLKILVQGLAKARVVSFVSREPFLRAAIEPLQDLPAPPKPSVELEALMRNVREQSRKILSLRDALSDEVVALLEGIDDPGRLADMIASNMRIKVEAAQKVLETVDPRERLKMVNGILVQEFQVSAMQAKLDSETHEEMDRAQREYYLREQLRTIKRELGEEAGHVDESAEYRAKFRKAHLPKEVSAEAAKQLSRLEWMHSDAAEAAIIRTYLDWIVELPWATSTRDHLDLAEAKRILDAEHYDLEKVKDRILEYLAVMKLNHRQKGPIICFLGPPGVGKTSLGQSIAKAMGRKFVRFSLGGMKDEAEIRGHRRTYIGALPGRIIQGLKTAGSNNPVFMLDEVDKIGSDFRGDPAAALLEVLDPEQNSSFSDHYLNVSFDLSKVMFITTANFLDPIPQALEDRMEVIYLSGYTAEEKAAIAKKHLLPRLIAEHGLKPGHVSIQDAALKKIIASYTQEAGLRALDRRLAAICRKAARRVAEGQDRPLRITPGQLSRYLGPPEVLPEPALSEGQPGVVTGLAWTEMGGELMYVEVRTMPGKGNLTLTGQLGEILKESAQTVLAFIRAHALELGLARDFYDELDIHIHVPAGAVPKEGPSAGVSLLIALVSALTGQPAPRDMAMTGEITLRGQIMAIGGLKEKALAALRSGIKKVVIPKQNLKDLEEIPLTLRRRIQFLPVDNIDELLQLSFPDKRFKPSAVGSAGRGRARRPPTRSRRRAPEQPSTTHG
ncbi:MAG: endopeptidase La [Deltaproteobacteria bacterium]|jgi:ATP-dependent Lon protease|nr:endopeptidase La [Deltaproteobacteria bacterium]